MMNKISVPLTQGYETLVSIEDTDLAEFVWTLCKHKNGGIYAQRHKRAEHTKSGWTTEGLHRVILSRILGRELLRHEEVDHKDLNGLNNQRYNLRLASRAQNMANRARGKRTGTSSQYKGVSWSKKYQKWQAQTSFQGKNIHLGHYDTEIEAHIIYSHKVKELYGEFANVGVVPP